MGWVVVYLVTGAGVLILLGVTVPGDDYPIDRPQWWVRLDMFLADHIKLFVLVLLVGFAVAWLAWPFVLAGFIVRWIRKLFR